MKPSEDKVLSDYWLEHYLGDHGRCVLCENSGRIKVRSPNGDIIREVFCFCPNGRALAEA